MIKTSVLGMPRIGIDADLPKAINMLLKKKITENDLNIVSKKIRMDNLQMQIDAGIDIIPSNDFSLYDHVLDTTVLVGNIPKRYYWEGGSVPLEMYFAMIKGQQKEKFDAMPLQTRRWFNTSYKYIVPELADPLDFAYSDNKAVLHFLEAKQIKNVVTRPVVLGPVSYLMLTKPNPEELDVDPLECLEEICNVYKELFRNFIRLGIKEVLLEEPAFSLDLTRTEQKKFKDCYDFLHKAAAGQIALHIATAYDKVGNNLECYTSLPCASFHFDLINGAEEVDDIISHLPKSANVSLGVVDANNIWVNDMRQSVDIIEKFAAKIDLSRIIISPSSSLFLCPLDVETDPNCDALLKKKLSFSKQKLHELQILKRYFNEGQSAVAKEMNQNQEIIKKIKQDNRKLSDALLGNKMPEYKRQPFAKRKELQKKNLNLSHFPITNIGDICYSKEAIDDTENCNVFKEIAATIKIQLDCGVDVPVYGESDRVSNIEYFAQNIRGFKFHSGCNVMIDGETMINVPILDSKIEYCKNEEMIKVAKCALESSENVKFTLLGPASLINYSFICDVDHLLLIGNATRVVSDQILELEKIGIKAIGLHEDVIFKRLPKRANAAISYVKQLADIWKSCVALIKDKTQIHVDTNSLSFQDSIEYLARFDIDVLLIEVSKAKESVFESLVSYKYQNDIGMGLFDPTSDRMPVKNDLSAAVKKASRVLEEGQIWLTPDAGYKIKHLIYAIKCMNLITIVARESRKNII